MTKSTHNARGAGRPSSGKVRRTYTLRVSPELNAFLKGLDNESGWIAAQLEGSYLANIDKKATKTEE